MAKHWIPLPSFKTILIIIVVVVYTITLTSLVVSIMDGDLIVRLPTVGNIITLGYEAHGGDIITNNGNATLDWGTTYVGASTNRSIYLRSKSNIDTTMNLTTANWTYVNTQGQNVTSPTTSSINLTWDYDNSTIKPNQEIYVTLTLSVPYDADFVEYLITNNVTRFSFDIHIYPS